MLSRPYKCKPLGQQQQQNYKDFSCGEKILWFQQSLQILHSNAVFYICIFF